MYKTAASPLSTTQQPLASHHKAAIPRKWSSITLRHSPTANSRRAETAREGVKRGNSVLQAAGKLPVVLAAGACSLLLSNASACSAAELSSIARAATPVPTVQQPQQQQQLAYSLPASLQLHDPAAAPALLASATATQPNQHFNSAAPAHADILQQLQLQQPQASERQQLQHAPLQQQQQQLPQEALQLALLDEPRVHWLLVVLGIGVVNIVGLQAVLKLLEASRDGSTPVTVLVCRMGLRVDSNKLQERLHFLRDMLGVEHAAFFTFEEAMQMICQPPRGCQLAYADLVAKPLGSKQAGYDLFKQQAMAEQVRAQQVEAARVLKDTKPEGPHHRNMLEKLLGAAETQDAEEAQSCMLVTLVVLAKGSVDLPRQPLRSLPAFRDAMKSLCGHLKLGQLLAVELLMTPDRPQDFLSEAQLMTDYPFLTDLSSGLRVDHPDWSAAPSPLTSADDYMGDQYVMETAAATAMAALAAEGVGAEGAASAAAAAAAVRSDERVG